MKKITLFFIFSLAFALIPSSYSFKPEKGFYAEYRVYEDPEFPYPTAAFALLREYREWEIKYLDIEDLVYKYQVLDIRQNKALVRICFQGIATIGWYSRKSAFFKRVFDVTIDLSTLEMIDDNGNIWGKWLFWIKLGSYNWKEYTLMKNWNNHGEVKGWLKGPWENITLSKFLRSSYASTLNHYFVAITSKKEGDTWIYPKFEEYGIAPSYKAHETEEGTIKIEPGGYHLGSPSFELNVKSTPGILARYYYTDEGLFFENILPYYIDDFLDQKLGITVLKVSSPLILTDYGVSDKNLIEDPTPEYQRTSFEKEVEMMVGKNEPEETPPKTETPPETTETPQEKSETPAPTTKQPNNTEETNILYYIAPLLVVVFIAVFIVLREKR